MLHLFDFSPLCKCDLREIGCFSIRTEWIKMLWVWTQFSAQSRFFVPFIDGVKPVGGNATIVKLDCCSIIAHGRHRALLWYYIVYCIVRGTWHRVAISHPDDTSAPMVEAQIVWMVQISTQMPKWSKSCFPNGPNGGRPDQCGSEIINPWRVG